MRDYDINGITANGEALADAWVDAVKGGGESALSRAAVGYADCSWGDGPALASGLLAAGYLFYSLNGQLGEGVPDHAKPTFELMLVTAGTLMSMYSLVLKNTDARLGTCMAQTVKVIIDTRPGPAHPIIINPDEVHNR